MKATNEGGLQEAVFAIEKVIDGIPFTSVYEGSYSVHPVIYKEYRKPFVEFAGVDSDTPFKTTIPMDNTVFYYKNRGDVDKKVMAFEEEYIKKIDHLCLMWSSISEDNFELSRDKIDSSGDPVTEELQRIVSFKEGIYLLRNFNPKEIQKAMMKITEPANIITVQNERLDAVSDSSIMTTAFHYALSRYMRELYGLLSSSPDSLNLNLATSLVDIDSILEEAEKYTEVSQ